MLAADFTTGQAIASDDDYKRVGRAVGACWAATKATPKQLAYFQKEYRELAWFISCCEDSWGKLIYSTIEDDEVTNERVSAFWKETLGETSWHLIEHDVFVFGFAKGALLEADRRDAHPDTVNHAR